MNIKLFIVTSILILCFIFGFEERSYSLNLVPESNISELKILNYLPKGSKTFFISNAKSANFNSDLRRNYETISQYDLTLIKDSIFAYLGLDLGKNKLEDIYNDELAIATYDNDEQGIDDVLIIFKIKEKKDIDDIINLSNKIDEPNKLIKIFRENKLNYLRYIYRTNDNYIITSSNKKFINDALQAKTFNKKFGTDNIFLNSILSNFSNEHNILLTRNCQDNDFLIYNNNYLKKDDNLLTLFDFKDKKVTLKSYLVNSSLDITSYKAIDKESKSFNTNYQISVYDNVSNCIKFLDNIDTNSIEEFIFKELKKNLKQNILFLSSNKNWVIIFDKNNLSLENIKFLEDFNKNSLENNNNIYTIYSKDILKKENNTIKKSFYKRIFSVESEDKIIISNNLVNEADINLISKEFISFKDESDAKYFLNKKINLKSPYSIQSINPNYLRNSNYFFKNLITVSILENKAVIKQSIPEINPIYYTETNLKIF